MTVRSLVIGLLVAIAVGTLAYVNGQLTRLAPLMGNHFPPAVFGLLMLLLAVNPLLGRIHKGARLGGKELAVILAMVLTACSIPRGSGALGCFTQSLVMPKVFERTDLSWRQTGVLDYVPPALLPGGRDREGVMVDRYLAGRGEGDPAGLAAVPWEAWRSPLTWWMPVLLLLAAASICLALIVHPEWARRERLRYPIALFADSLLARQTQGAGPPIWRRQAFWLGLGTLVVIYGVNCIHAFFPSFIEISLQFNFRPAAQLFPWMREVPLHVKLFDLALIPSMMAFGTLLASDIGLSLGLANLFHVLAMAALLQWGITSQEDIVRGGPWSWQVFGSYLAMGLLILYTGRRYYGRLAVAALTPGGRRMAGEPVWAARGLIVSTAALTALLAHFGMPWFLALLIVLLLLLLFMVISRLTAECGLIQVRPGWLPATALTGLFGSAALGPQAMVLTMLVSVMLAMDPQMSLMPYAVTGLKIGEDRSVRPRLIGWAQAGTYAAALAAVLVVALTVNYNFGVMREDTYPARSIPSMPYGAAAAEINKLQITGQLERSQGLSDWQRLTGMAPSRQFLQFAGIGLALVAVFSFLRLRLPWWPLHPVIFLIWGSQVAATLAPSYLLGWIARTVTFRLGGGAAYRLLVVFMIGVVAGELLGIMVNMIAGAVYFAATGLPPPVLPGVSR